MSHSCFIHSSIDGYLSCFHILVIVNNTAINIGMLMFFQISVLGSFRHITRSGITGSKSRSIFNFNFLGYLHTVFQSGQNSLHSHQHGKSFPLFPHLIQHLLFVDLLIIATLILVRRDLYMVLI